MRQCRLRWISVCAGGHALCSSCVDESQNLSGTGVLCRKFSLKCRFPGCTMDQETQNTSRQFLGTWIFHTLSPIRLFLGVCCWRYDDIHGRKKMPFFFKENIALPLSFSKFMFLKYGRTSEIFNTPGFLRNCF